MTTRRIHSSEPIFIPLYLSIDQKPRDLLFLNHVGAIHWHGGHGELLVATEERALLEPFTTQLQRRRQEQDHCQKPYFWFLYYLFISPHYNQTLTWSKTMLNVNKKIKNLEEIVLHLQVHIRFKMLKANAFFVHSIYPLFSEIGACRLVCIFIKWLLVFAGFLKSQDESPYALGNGQEVLLFNPYFRKAC